jgi:death-on-curing protein
MRYLTLGEVLELHRMVVGSQRALVTIRDLSALESALAQPQATFEGQALYPSLSEQAGALCFSLVTNHPFLDGNKRTAHAAMETFLVLNGAEIVASIDEQERLMLELASGQCSREALVEWLHRHLTLERK